MSLELNRHGQDRPSPVFIPFKRSTLARTQFGDMPRISETSRTLNTVQLFSSCLPGRNGERERFRDRGGKSQNGGLVGGCAERCDHPPRFSRRAGRGAIGPNAFLGPTRPKASASPAKHASPRRSMIDTGTTSRRACPSSPGTMPRPGEPHTACRPCLASPSAPGERARARVLPSSCESTYHGPLRKAGRSDRGRRVSKAIPRWA